MLMDVLLNLLDPSKQTTPPYVPGSVQPPSAFAGAPFPVNPNPAPPPQLSPVTVPQRDLQMADPEVQRMMAAMNAPAFRSVSGGSTTPRPQDPGLLSRLGRGALDYLADPINRKQMAIGFNAMRLNPDANLARSLQSQIETEQGMRLLRSQGNKTADALEARADKIANTDPQRAAQMITAAEFIRNNPTNTEGVSAAAKLLFDSSSQFAPTVSGVQTDPVTGEQYVVITDRNTMQPKRMTVGGATQLTPEQQADLDTRQAIQLQDIKFAQETGQAVMGQAESLNQSIEKYYLALDALDRGGKSGPFESRIVALDAATAQLRSVANQLGIDVINSATFGALSESELRLALATQLDLNLPEDELRKQLEAQIRAKDKMRAELIKMAKDLTSGVGYSDYIAKYQFVPMAPPEGVPLNVWRAATPAQKRELMQAAQ